jgi:AbrB family looped-hinge helix DNA binding protein
METVKLSAKGRIVIPKSIREAGHLSPGAEFKVSLVGTEIRIQPVERIVPTELDSVAGCLQRPGGRPLDDEQTEHAIAEMLGAQDRASRE